MLLQQQLSLTFFNESKKLPYEYSVAATAIESISCNHCFVINRMQLILFQFYIKHIHQLIPVNVWYQHFQLAFSKNKKSSIATLMNLISTNTFNRHIQYFDICGKKINH